MLTVHAICRATNQFEFDVEGLSDSDRVYSIHDGAICAVVSSTSDVNYANLDRETALKQLLIHQRIVEATMLHGAVLPVKFGTVLPSEDKVVLLLNQARGLITDTIQEYEGKVQVEVSVHWDTAKVFLALSQLDSVIEIKQKAESGDQEARRMLGLHVKELMDEQRSTFSAQILPRLKGITQAMVVQPVMADEVVVNVAMLIDKQEELLLDEVLNAIDDHYEGEFTIRCMGPMPLYSFATLHAAKLDADRIEQACEVLELPSPATLEGLKRAYRKKAQLIHPDTMDANIESAPMMAELTDAYQLLLSFAKSQLMNSAQVEGERCHFDADAVEKNLLISLEKQSFEVEAPVP